MGCTTSTGRPLPPLDTAPKDASALPTAVDVPTVEAVVPSFVRTILNHSRVMEDEYVLGKQLGK